MEAQGIAISKIFHIHISSILTKLKYLKKYK